MNQPAALALDFDSTAFALLDAMRQVETDERITAQHVERIHYADAHTWASLVDLCGPSNEQLKAAGQAELSHEERVPIMLEIFDRAMHITHMRKIGLIEGVAEHARAMHEKGIEIHIVTDRPENRMLCTETMLRMNAVPFTSINKVRSGDKAQWCLDRGIEVIVDDHPQTIADASLAGLEVLSLEYPFNVNEAAAAGASLHQSWATLGPAVEAAIMRRYRDVALRPAREHQSDIRVSR